MILNKLKERINFLRRKKIFPENEELKIIFSSYYKGYVLGSSPSINKYDFKNLDENSLIISMGNFHEHENIKLIKPNIHVFAASHPPITKSVLESWYKRAEYLLPKNTIVMVEKRDYNVAKEIFKSRKLLKYSYGGNIPGDFAKKILSPTTVGIVAIQLCHYLDLNEVNLIGIDHDWQTKDGYTHFYDHKKPSLEFFLKQEGIFSDDKIHVGRASKERLYGFYNMYKQYELFKSHNYDKKFKIYNSDPLSGFDVFERKNN